MRILYTTWIELQVCTLSQTTLDTSMAYEMNEMTLKLNECDTHLKQDWMPPMTSSTYEAILQILNLKKYMQKTWYELQEVTNTFIAMSTNAPTLP